MAQEGSERGRENLPVAKSRMDGWMSNHTARLSALVLQAGRQQQPEVSGKYLSLRCWLWWVAALDGMRDARIGSRRCKAATPLTQEWQHKSSSSAGDWECRRAVQPCRSELRQADGPWRRAQLWSLNSRPL